MPSAKKKVRKLAAGSKKAAAELLVEKVHGDSPKTGKYDPSLSRMSNLMAAHWKKTPPFSLNWAAIMCHDHQVKFGFTVVNGPQFGLEVKVDSPHRRVQEFVEAQWKRIWSQEAEKLLRDQRWGYSAFEVMYRYADGQYQFDRYEDRHPGHVGPLVLNQKLVGVNFHNAGSRGQLSLWGPQSLWLTYDGEYGNLFGTSILESPFAPWFEKTMESGAIRMRQLRMIKDAWIGDVIGFDIDQDIETPGGQTITAQQMAMEVMENRYSGGVVATPFRIDGNGNKIPILDYTGPTPVSGATQVMEWVHDLDWDIFDGMGIPREVVEAAETGSGYSGRAVPNVKFLAGLNPKCSNRIRQVKEQTLVPLVAANFGADAADEFDIELVPLEESMGENQPQQPPPAPGRDTPQGPQPPQNGFMSNRLNGNGQAQQFAAWDESKHPRGQPGNAGEFGSGHGEKRAETPPTIAISDGLKEKYPGVKLDLFQHSAYKDRRVWELARIVIPEESRGQGIGTKIMQEIVQEADKHGATIMLDPSTDFGASSKKRLIQFYAQFGFKPNKGRSADQSPSGSMIRLPQGGLHQFSVDDQRARYRNRIRGRLSRLLEK